MGQWSKILIDILIESLNRAFDRKSGMTLMNDIQLFCSIMQKFYTVSFLRIVLMMYTLYTICDLVLPIYSSSFVLNL